MQNRRFSPVGRSVVSSIVRTYMKLVGKPRLIVAPRVH